MDRSENLHAVSGSRVLSDKVPHTTHEAITSCAEAAPTLVCCDASLQAFIFPGADRDAYVPVTIEHALGTTKVHINETMGKPGEWTSLGTYSFSDGTCSKVTVSNYNTTGTVIVDAVRLTEKDTGRF